MIGIISNKNDYKVIEEFFELFKINWEFFNSSKKYEAVICTTDNISEKIFKGSVVIIYNSKETNFDIKEKNFILSKESNINIYDFNNNKIPIYNNLISFSENNSILLTQDKKTVGFKKSNIIRIGYDVFKEVEFLLTNGQPIENSMTPTLDLHINLLRELLIKENISFLEIINKPNNYNFMAALTHDVDFATLKVHKFDKVYFGFLYRAIVGSIKDLLEKRKNIIQLLKNWIYAILSPLTFINLFDDFWNEFKRYTKIEKGIKSTYFFIPFKNKSGIKFEDGFNKNRRVKYDVDDVSNDIKKLELMDYEIGVHGIDSWYDIKSGEQEINRIKNTLNNKNQKTGIRMHWLAFNEYSFKNLEEAGYYYDSTIGYNESLGFKAGTLMVYRPIGLNKIFELPMHLQDTALFYPRRMHLNDNQAWDLFLKLYNSVKILGGVLTILYHTRSISPERLWDKFYKKLILFFKKENVWITSGREIVGWFEMRRSFKFKQIEQNDYLIKINYNLSYNDKYPALILRNYSKRLSEFKIEDYILEHNKFELVINKG